MKWRIEMKTTAFFISTILVAGFLAGFQSRSNAQTCGLPPSETSIITASGTSLDVTYQFDLPNYRYATLVGDGYCLTISWWPDGMGEIDVEISNGDSRWSYGTDTISLGNILGWEQSGDVVDLSALPPDYRELWENCMEISGELIESDDFIVLINEAGKDKVEEVKQTLEWIRDGLCRPYGMEQFFTISFITSGWACDMKPGRGFSLEGPMTMHVATPDPIGEPSPEIYINPSFDFGSYTNVHIDPETETVTVTVNNYESEEATDNAAFYSLIDDIIVALNFYLGQEAALIEGGMIDEELEYGFLLGKALEGLNSYPVEIVAQEY